MDRRTCRIISITKEEGDQELWSFQVGGANYAMYVSKGTTFDEAMAKILNVAEKSMADLRLGKYELVKDKPPHKIASNDELEEDLHKLEDSVKKLEKLWLTSG